MILAEPARDTRAQVRAVADPGSAKDAAFFARGTKVPAVSRGLHRVDRPEGTLVTSHGGKAVKFARARALTDGLMAELLGHAESKREALSKGFHGVVQGITPEGGVAHEALASRGGVMEAARRAGRAVPGGSVRVVSLPAALRRRLGHLVAAALRR